MKLLLDTHALLWWLADDARLGVSARNLIADPGNNVLVSIVSPWEVIVKMRVGKLKADIGTTLALIERNRFTLLPISPAHLLALAVLPFHHRDPFDHLLIAQAVAEGAAFLSEDRRASQYPLQVIACST
ncbi:MAG TPA: type II toxin-antitoxin system VapC family toxin [Acetobacteraceae bacterium]